MATPERVNPDYEQTKVSATGRKTRYAGSHTITTVSMCCAFRICSKLLPVVATHLIFRRTISFASSVKRASIPTLGEPSPQEPNDAISFGKRVVALQFWLPRTERETCEDGKWSTNFLVHGVIPSNVVVDQCFAFGCFFNGVDKQRHPIEIEDSKVWAKAIPVSEHLGFTIVTVAIERYGNKAKSKKVST